MKIPLEAMSHLMAQGIVGQFIFCNDVTNIGVLNFTPERTGFERDLETIEASSSTFFIASSFNVAGLLPRDIGSGGDVFSRIE